MAARGTFGNHKFPGLFGNFLATKIKNVANTNVIYWGGRLLALWEGGLPYKLDPKTLRCDDKEYTLRGLLKKGETFTAHPRVDSKQNRLVAFSCKQNPYKSAIVKVFEFDNTLTSVAERSFVVPGETQFAPLLCLSPTILFFNMLRQLISSEISIKLHLYRIRFLP
jgi:all-trans-8'-apo-beta-carotenal 15,15'-oxygenase